MTKQYLTVSALTKYIKRKLEMDPHLKNIWLKGEISNFNHHSRGHMYMTIKDEESRIQAVMFAGYNRSLKFIPEDGMNVLIRGDIGVFEPYGQYQLYIHQMEPDGVGALYFAFEQLKEKLSKEGYFDERYKRKIPSYPKHIGIITSPTGAAVRDIITTIKRRYPIVQLTVIPAIVQGELGPKSIVKAIRAANEKAIFDLLIVGRGGGSIEELWNFNNEEVAKAIFHSEIPVISAVGHETDQTIADFVADFRAPTPTAAAEIAVPSQIDLFDKINQNRQMISHMISLKLDHLQTHLHRLNQSYAFKYPDHLIKQKEQILDKYDERLEKILNQFIHVHENNLVQMEKRLISQHPKAKIERSKEQLELHEKQLKQLFEKALEQNGKQLGILMEKLVLLNPLEVMRRGYAIPYTDKGKIVSTISQVQRNDFVKIRISDGEIDCHVLKVKEIENE